MILALYLVLVRHLKCHVRFWAPQSRKKIKVLEQFQRAMELEKGLGSMSCEEQLGELWVFSLEKRKPRGSLSQSATP